MFIKVSVSKSQPIKVPLNVHCKVYCYTGLSWLLGYCLVTTHVLSSPVTTHSLLNLHTHTQVSFVSAMFLQQRTRKLQK